MFRLFKKKIQFEDQSMYLTCNYKLINGICCPQTICRVVIHLSFNTLFAE